jgi:hypothetical protein
MDWGRWGTFDGISRRLAAVTSGDIVLMHDARPEANRPQATLAALSEFLRTEHAASLSFSPLSELIKKPG